MKNIKYSAPEISFVSLRASDVITLSATTVGEDGVIQLKEYVLGGFNENGGFNR